MPRALLVLCLLLPRLAAADLVRGWEMGGTGELATRTSDEGAEASPAVAGRAWGALRLFGTGEAQTAATEVELAPEVTWGGLPRLSAPRLYIARPYREVAGRATFRLLAGHDGRSWGEVLPVTLRWARLAQDDLVQHRIDFGFIVARCGPSSETCIGRGVHIDEVRVLGLDVIVLPGDIVTWGVRTMLVGFDGLRIGEYELGADLGFGVIFLEAYGGKEAYASIASPLLGLRLGRLPGPRGSWRVAYRLDQAASIDDRILAENRLQAAWQYRGLETGLYLAYTSSMRWGEPADGTFTTGHWSRYTFGFGDHVLLSFDAEAGRSFYGDLAGEETPRATWGVSALTRLTLVARR